MGNSVTFNNVTKKIAMAGAFHAAELHAAVLPSCPWHQPEQASDAVRESPFPWCCSGLINYLDKDNSAFTVEYLLSSWFLLAPFCFASHYCPSWAEGLSVLVGRLSSSKGYASRNWIRAAINIIRFWQRHPMLALCSHRFQGTWTSPSGFLTSTSGFLSTWIFPFGLFVGSPSYPLTQLRCV